MFEIECPYCGARDQAEFAAAGEAHIVRPTNGDDLSDAEWAEFVFMRANGKGVHRERWYHIAGCRKFFNMMRNTATDEILGVYEIGAEPPVAPESGLATPSGETIGSGNDAVKVLRENGGEAQ